MARMSFPLDRARLPVPMAVLVVAGAVVAGLLVLSPAYGFHRDELYFVVAGRHPAFGYVDQPPLTPLLSAGAVGLLGLSPTAIRILPALAVGATVMLAALIARDLGGGRRAQLLAAAVTALSGFLAAGHLASTTTYDLLAWAVVLWLVVRLLAGADPRTWLAVGLVAGIALQNKHTMLFLGAGLAGGLLLARRWDAVRSPWAWGAVAVALLSWAPNLAWQAANGFPQLEMAASIAVDAGEERAKLGIELLLLAGPLLFPVALAGGWWLLRDPAARPWRAPGWAALVILVLVLVSGGKSYYVVGVYPLLFGAGAIVVDGWLARGRPRLRVAAFSLAAVVSGVLLALLALPIVPAASLAKTPIPDVYKESAEQVGWPEFVAFVEGTVATLSPEERGRAVILTSNYGEAGALELLGSGLPPVHSGHNGYWDWGPPAENRTIAILVGGWNRGSWSRFFASCRPRGVFDNGLGLRNEEQGVSVEICRDLRAPWSEIWADFRHLG
jgi:hypothetical protein